MTHWPRYETYNFDTWCPILTQIGRANIKHPHGFISGRSLNCWLGALKERHLRVYTLWSQVRSFLLRGEKKGISTTTKAIVPRHIGESSSYNISSDNSVKICWSSKACMRHCTGDGRKGGNGFLLPSVRAHHLRRTKRGTYSSKG